MEQTQLKKKITIHKYLKKDVAKSFKKAIQENDVAMSIQWVLELHRSGFIQEALMILEEMQFGSCLPLNLRFIKQFEVRLTEIRERLKMDTDVVELNAEDQETANLLTEMAGILAMSDKIGTRKKTKLGEEDLMFHTLYQRLEYGGQNQLNGIWKTDDPFHLQMFINELAGSIANKKSAMVWYWWDWLNNWETEHKKTKKTYTRTSSRLRTMDETVWSLVANIMARDETLAPVTKIALNIQQNSPLFQISTQSQNLKRFATILEGVLNFTMFPINSDKPLCNNTVLLRQQITEVSSKWMMTIPQN